MIYTPLFRKTEKMTIHRGISLSEKGKAKKQKDEIDSYFYVFIIVIHAVLASVINMTIFYSFKLCCT